MLDNPRAERFCHEYVTEYLKVPRNRKACYAAYARAGYAPHRFNCHRLLRQELVKARLLELLSEARERADVRPEKALMRVDRVADAKLTDFYEMVDVAGRRIVRLRDITKLPPRLAEAISEIEFHDDGRLKRIKLHDKITANAALLKHFAGEVPDARPTTVNIFQALSADDQKLLVEALEAIAPATIDAEPASGD